MKNLIFLLFTFISLCGNSQQVITMCEFSKKEFTYTTYSQESGIFTWDIDGQFMPTTTNSLTVDWSTYDIGIYTISVYFENSAGCYADPIEFVIFIKECNVSIIYAPNTFTPDNDTYNDEWKPIAYNVTDGSYIIFNRWGEIIYESYNLEIGWPGTYGLNGRVVKDGVYVYVIEYLNAVGVKEKLVGHVTLLR